MKKEINNIEDTIFDEGLPVNTIAVLKRIEKLLNEHKTNAFYDNDKVKNDFRIQKVMLLLNMMFYGQFANIDIPEIFHKLYTRQRKQNRRE